MPNIEVFYPRKPKVSHRLTVDFIQLRKALLFERLSVSQPGSRLGGRRADDAGVIDLRRLRA